MTYNIEDEIFIYAHRKLIWKLIQCSPPKKCKMESLSRLSCVNIGNYSFVCHSIYIVY